MEVKTGKIKAIANLTRDGKDSTGSYSENLNYAIGYATEPGSTFKLASYLAVIDDYDLSLNERNGFELSKSTNSYLLFTTSYIPYPCLCIVSPKFC